MKITKAEVVEALGEVAELVDVHIGTESDGDRVIACVMGSFDAQVAAVCNRTIVKLNNQGLRWNYVPITLSKRWFKHYVLMNGFKEVEVEPVEPPFPIEFRWEKDYVVIYVNGHLLQSAGTNTTKHSLQAVSEFCRQNLQESVNQRQS